MPFSLYALSRFGLALSLIEGLGACTTGVSSAADEIGSEDDSGSDSGTSSDVSTESTESTESTDSSSDTDDTGISGSPPEAPTLQLSLSQIKRFDFSWTAGQGAQFYQLLERVNEGDPYVQVGDDVLGLSTSLTVPLHRRANASYIVRACNDSGCTDSEAVNVVGTLVEAVGYLKASNTGGDDLFGCSVALSADGSTLAVGAQWESSKSAEIDGDQADDSMSEAGAVYVFVRDDQGKWSQQAYVKASDASWGDWFGESVALSGDGNTLVVGAPVEGSKATGIDGVQVDYAANGAGAVYVFERDGQGEWSQQAYVKASNTDANDWFGRKVALSGDGNTLAVSAPGEDSEAMGVDGNQLDDSASEAGAAYVFERDGQGEWSQQAYVKASNTDADDGFGGSVALSGDGNVLAVGAHDEDSKATGIDGDQADDSAQNSGAVYVFERDGQGKWSQQAYVKASNTGAFDWFGCSVALTDDGTILAVGAQWEDSNATGIDGDQVDDSGNDAGAVYVFERDSQGEWSQQAYVKTFDTGVDNFFGAQEDVFGTSVALSGAGDILVVGAHWEDSNATGIGGDPINEFFPLAGAVYVYGRDGQGQWAQQAYVKASNTDASDDFGRSVALSSDGNTLAVGAVGEDSETTGINGNQADDSAFDAGAVYLY